MRIKIIRVAVLALFTVVGTQQLGQAANSGELREYTVKQSAPSVGTNLKKDIVKTGTIPLDKTYAELTEDQKQRLKDVYDRMPAGDEPPFPEKGLLSIYRAVGTVHENTEYQHPGPLNVEVLVDSTGEPKSVDILTSPDADITTAVVTSLMHKKYKPAICSGQPCAMKMPIHAELLSLDSQAMKSYNAPGVSINGAH